MVLQHLWKVWEHGPQTAFLFLVKESTKHQFSPDFWLLGCSRRPCRGQAEGAVGLGAGGAGS